MTGSFQTHELQHTRLHCPSLSPWVWSSSCPLSQLCYPTISSSVTPFFSCPQFFPDWGSFPMSQLFTLEGQSIDGATASVFTLNIQGSFPLGLTGLISFKSINSLTLSLLCGPTLISIHDYWKNHSSDQMDLCQQSDVSALFMDIWTMIHLWFCCNLWICFISSPWVFLFWNLGWRFPPIRDHVHPHKKDE